MEGFEEKFGVGFEEEREERVVGLTVSIGGGEMQ